MADLNLREISFTDRIRQKEIEEQKASAKDAFFINLDKGVIDVLRQDQSDEFRNNNIPQKLKNTPFIKEIRKAGFEDMVLNSLEDREIFGDGTGLNRE